LTFETIKYFCVGVISDETYGKLFCPNKIWSLQACSKDKTGSDQFQDFCRRFLKK
jgi:hypothetical protein